MKFWEPKPLGTLWATPGLLRDSFTFCILRESVDLYNIKMTNSLRLTHHVLLCARLHVSVLSDHHQALL